MVLTPSFWKNHRQAFLRVLLAAGLAHSAHAQAPAAIVVPVLQVQAGSAQAVLELEGNLEPQLQAVLSAQVPGSLRSLAVQAGDSVRAGQVLARLDERALEAGLAGGDAAVAQAQAALAQARQQAQRTRELQAQGFISTAALDSAQAQLQAAQAGLAAAQAGRQQAAVARGHAVLTAPFAGLVRATHLEVGDLASPGSPVLTLYAPERLRAVVQLPLSRAEAARLAASAQLLLPDGSILVPVRQVEVPGADATSQTLVWRLDLAPEAVARHRLQPGTPVRVRFVPPAAGANAGALPATASPALAIPAAALLRRGELTAVYAVEGGQFVLRAVRVGTLQAGQWPVHAGLRAGEHIAADALQAGLAGAVPAPAATR